MTGKPSEKNFAKGIRDKSREKPIPRQFQMGERQFQMGERFSSNYSISRYAQR
jgi:hypothetical protein